jgi:hypothetical protein
MNSAGQAWNAEKYTKTCLKGSQSNSAKLVGTGIYK